MTTHTTLKAVENDDITTVYQEYQKLREGIIEFLRASREQGEDGWGRDWWRCKWCNQYVRSAEDTIEHQRWCPCASLQELVK